MRKYSLLLLLVGFAPAPQAPAPKIRIGEVVETVVMLMTDADGLPISSRLRTEAERPEVWVVK